MRSWPALLVAACTMAACSGHPAVPAPPATAIASRPASARAAAVQPDPPQFLTFDVDCLETVNVHDGGSPVCVVRNPVVVRATVRNADTVMFNAYRFGTDPGMHQKTTTDGDGRASAHFLLPGGDFWILDGYAPELPGALRTPGEPRAYGGGPSAPSPRSFRVMLQGAPPPSIRLG